MRETVPCRESPHKQKKNKEFNGALSLEETLSDGLGVMNDVKTIMSCKMDDFVC